MKCFSLIREYFWPLLDPLKKKDFNALTDKNIVIKDDDVDDCYDLTLKYYDSEDDRKKVVESKSTIFIGAVGFVIAILLSMATGLILNPKVQLSFLTSFSIIMWVFIVIFFCRAVWFSIKALERQKYDTISYKDFINKTDFKRELILDIINKTRKNSITVNLKVDNMVMAQEYFKRGIIAVVLYAVIAGLCGLISKSSFNYEDFANIMSFVFNCKWLVVFNVCLLIINIIIICFTYCKRIKQ